MDITRPVFGEGVAQGKFRIVSEDAMPFGLQVGARLIIVAQRVVYFADWQHSGAIFFQASEEIACLNPPETEFQRIQRRRLKIGAQIKQAGAVVISPVIAISQAVVILLLVSEAEIADFAQGATGPQCVVFNPPGCPGWLIAKNPGLKPGRP